MKDRALLPLVNQWLEKKEKKLLEDKNMYYDIFQDHTYLTYKIRIAYGIRLVRLVT